MDATQPQLGRLEKVDLRMVWENEAQNFTPWLAKQENISLLGQTIGMELEVEAQEKEVGPFRADILCRELPSDDWVLIENQLEPTDHIHLGQLLTYAAGLNAVTIVWISQRIRDEHRAALDWLNEVTSENIRFFGLEIEAWRIGDSLPAPKFNIVCRPNEWSREVAERASSGELTPAQSLQLEYWTSFREYALEHARRFKPRKARPQTWMDFALGRTGFALCATASTWNSQTQSYDTHELRAEVIVDLQDCAWVFSQIKDQREEIEAQLGEQPIWAETENVRLRRIYFRRDVNLNDRKSWPDYNAWLTTKLDKLHEVFQPIVRNLDLKAPTMEENDSLDDSREG